MPLVGGRNRTNAIFIVEGLRLLSSGRSSGQGRKPIRGQRPKTQDPGGTAGFAPKCVGRGATEAETERLGLGLGLRTGAEG
jgi:hypothetical protein